MNPINLQVLFADGTTKEASAIAADLIAFETKFDMSVAKLSSEVRLTHLFFIAWHVMHRTKVTALDFEQWAETVAAVTEAEPKK